MTTVETAPPGTLEVPDASRKKTLKSDNPKLAKRSQKELEKLKAFGMQQVLIGQSHGMDPV